MIYIIICFKALYPTHIHTISWRETESLVPLWVVSHQSHPCRRIAVIPFNPLQVS